MVQTKLVQFNCPAGLLLRFDEVLKTEFNDRTDALLALMRDYVNEKEAKRVQKEVQESAK